MQLSPQLQQLRVLVMSVKPTKPYLNKWQFVIPLFAVLVALIGVSAVWYKNLFSSYEIAPRHQILNPEGKCSPNIVESNNVSFDC